MLMAIIHRQKQQQELSSSSDGRPFSHNGHSRREEGAAVLLSGGLRGRVPMNTETAVGGLFLQVMRVLCYVVASKLAQSGTGCQPTTGILLPVQRDEYSTSQVTGSTFLPSIG